MRRAILTPAVLVLATSVYGCDMGDAQQALPVCDPGNGAIKVPDGFCAVVVAEGVEGARHLAVRPNGDVFVATYGGRGAGAQPGGVVVLRDTTGDGHADVRTRFGDVGGSGIALRDDLVYFAPNDGVVRFSVPGGAMEPVGQPEVVVQGLPNTRSHRAKSIVVSDAGDLFVNIGSPTNSCQVQDRTAGSPGQDPCPDLERRAGIWRFDADATGQAQDDGERWATGMRNTVALAMDPATGQLFGAIHGRDQLGQNWPEHFSLEQSAELPAEEFVRVEQGSDFGWPYCFYDWEADRKVLAPEYGGDGETVGRCAAKDDALLAFPGHWAPNGLLFYTGSQFPERFRGGVFIAFHGSWNRSPMPQEGYNVVFVPFRGGAPAGEWSVFADGFPGGNVSPNGAAHRPTGLALGPDGSLYISDDAGGTIWRVMYRPDAP